MKTFNDLVFKQHREYDDLTIARVDFDNGYPVSVITGEPCYSSEDEPFEVAVLYDEQMYNSPDIPELTEDVIGYQTEEQVTGIIRQVQII